MSNRDYYQILSVPQGASFEQIDAAYRAIVQQYESSGALSQDGEHRLATINDAYDTLAHAPFRAAYDRAYATLHQPQEALDNANISALRALGEVVFDLARNTGAGIEDNWVSLRIGVARPPAGLWQATFESTLEEILSSPSTQSVKSIVLNAAWTLAPDETERRARRQTLGARSPTYYYALCFDFALSIVAVAADVLGYRFGLLGLKDRPDAEAWLAAFDAAYETALSEFQRRYPDLQQGGTVDERAYEALYNLAADRAFESTRPYISQESLERVMSTDDEYPRRETTKGCGSQLIVLGVIAAGIVSFTLFGLTIF